MGPVADTSEQVYISSLALLKMLKHGRVSWKSTHKPSASSLYRNILIVLQAGVPMEVMGLMLGEFIDDYTILVVDVFSMPQSGRKSRPIRAISSQGTVLAWRQLILSTRRR